MCRHRLRRRAVLVVGLWSTFGDPVRTARVSSTGTARVSGTGTAWIHGRTARAQTRPRPRAATRRRTQTLSTRITIPLSQESLKSGPDKRFKSGHFRLHLISSTTRGARGGLLDKSCFI